MTRSARSPLMLAGLVACAHAAASSTGVPIALGRWSPPDPQSCYIDEMQPRELPTVSAVLDSAALMGTLRDHPAGLALIALAFDSLGRPERVRVVDRRMSPIAAEEVRTTVAGHLRPLPKGEPWGARLLVSIGPTVAIAIARRQVCPPVVARIEARALARAPSVEEREPDLSPSPDWILRGDAAPGSPGRSILATAAARNPVDASTSADSASSAPDVLALGDDVLTLRVLIDTTGAIAHAELSRAAAARVDRTRLAAELARYRFHPALEDRVPVASWAILRIK